MTLMISSDKSLLLVAQDNDDIVGCCFGDIRDNEEWATNKLRGYIGLTFVKNDYRKKGIGKLLLNEIMKWLQKSDIKDIRLWVYDKNIEAIDFYRQCGFKNHIIEMIYGN